jgi:tetratricopeptide (TPR) repeat protein
MATRGYAATEVMETYTRARELCEQMGEIPQLFRVLQGLAGAYITRAEYWMAKELGEQLLTLAQNGQDPALLPQAHHVLGGALFYLGEFASAHTHLMRGIALYDPRQFRSDAFLYGAWVGCLGFAALALWYLGYPEQALQKIQQAIALAQELSNPYILTSALHFAAWLHLIRGEAHAALERVDAEIAISRDQGWPLYVSLATALRGWALVQLGQVEEGIAQIRQGLTAYRALGENGLSLMLSHSAEVFARLGRTEEGLTVLAEAFMVMEKNDERIYQAELYRLKGELLLSSAIPGALEAEACFRQAVAIAQRQGAKSLELQAVVSLSRLWQQQGKQEEARQRLAEIYGWFTEGFDTADLQATRTLLHALS